MPKISGPDFQIPMDESLSKKGATTNLRVLVADDQSEVLKVVTKIVSEKFQVVGMAENGRRALELAGLLSPDIILLDISMPIMNGFETASYLKKTGSSARVIFMTAHEDSGFVEAALSVGGCGYVMKRCLATDLILSISKAAKGEIFISESMH